MNSVIRKVLSSVYQPLEKKEDIRAAVKDYLSYEEKRREVERKFWANELSVEPRAFMGNVRGIKSQIESIRKSPHSNFNN